jgi:hypothetical protein
MKCIAASFLAIIAVVAFPALAHADMYKWTDKAGVVHFSSQPGDPSAELLKEEDLAPMSKTGEASPSNLVPEKIFFPGAITVTGGLLFDGKPLPEFTTAPAVIRLYSQHLKQWFTPDYSYDAGAGTFQLRGIAEGIYTGQVTVDADRSNPDQYPGDYKGSIFLNAVPTSPAVVTVDMERIMHLTSPEDNSVPLADWGAVCSNRTEFERPVAIAWEPLGNGVSYGYSIVRTVCRPFGFKEAVAADRTTASRVVLDLPPNKEGEFYTLRLEARKNDRLVGSLMTHGKNGWGWDYRFRVLPKRGPTRVISPIKN